LKAAISPVLSEPLSSFQTPVWLPGCTELRPRNNKPTLQIYIAEKQKCICVFCDFNQFNIDLQLSRFPLQVGLVFVIGEKGHKTVKMCILLETSPSEWALRSSAESQPELATAE
jgi:hypothetical protein